MISINQIILFICIGSAYSRQIGLITDAILTFKSSGITTSSIADENNFSCELCVCTALTSPIDYVAINCYLAYGTCKFIGIFDNVTGIVSSPNNIVYILSDVAISSLPTNSSTKSDASTIGTSPFKPSFEATEMNSVISSTSTTASDSSTIGEATTVTMSGISSLFTNRYDISLTTTEIPAPTSTSTANEMATVITTATTSTNTITTTTTATTISTITTITTTTTMATSTTTITTTATAAKTITTTITTSNCLWEQVFGSLFCTH